MTAAVISQTALQQTQSRLLARVEQAFLHPAHTVAASASIVQVAQVFREQRCTSVLVEGMGGQTGLAGLGIFTATSLHHAILDGRPLDALPVGDLARHPVITVAAGSSMGDAMVLLLRRRIHHLLVVDEQQHQVLGLLRALDVFGFLSNQSHLVAVHLDQASDLEGLAQAAGRMTELVAALHQGGMRMDWMCRLVQQLNARLFERAWQMIAPPDLVANSCLFVMGSEGRGEQLLKTDQDNGLLLRDGYTPPENLAQICQEFSDALARFGYPPCPGNIMLNNPAWRGTVQHFGQQVRQWLLMPQSDSLMHLAIFLDAHAVAGDGQLLAEVQQSLLALRVSSDVQIARFAAVAPAFIPHTSWWQRLLGRGMGAGLSVKKAGIFPIVHGVRSLALAQGISATNTAERLAALQAAQVLDAPMAQALQEGLHYLLELRLQAGLDELAQGKPVSGAVQVEALSRLERHRLQAALELVQRFMQLLRQRLRLDMV
ncbi:MAG: CBS domain-containing protein [Comamonas sp.]|nr:CBS domain-containing protein [Comamonas sp.]